MPTKSGDGFQKASVGPGSRSAGDLIGKTLHLEGRGWNNSEAQGRGNREGQVGWKQRAFTPGNEIPEETEEERERSAQQTWEEGPSCFPSGYLSTSILSCFQVSVLFKVFQRTRTRPVGSVCV